jgi:small subunit ribosomal protein S20
MANHLSAQKRVRQEARRTEVNRKHKTRLRHQIRAIRKAIVAKDGAAASALIPQTFSVIDTSAQSGIIKKNTAARYKSRLHLRIKALAAPKS